MNDEGRELKASDQAVRVRVEHVLERDADVVLRRHVVRDVVVQDEPEEAVQQREVDLFEDLIELGLDHDHTLALRSVPHVMEIVHALAPLVH